MKYGEAYFQPMVSLVSYLAANDYQVFIVSATYRDAVRVMTEGVHFIRKVPGRTSGKETDNDRT
ncbi:MAG: hypothetical protein J6O43_02280 [Clostridium sp.]|nr:hypothetical protein [Clostridium sp.]